MDMDQTESTGTPPGGAASSSRPSKSRRVPKSRRPRGQNERREQILEVAARLFAEKGYQATSIQDIADEVDLLKGSLYYYFESKQELLLEVARKAHTVPFDELFALLDAASDAADKVRRFVDYFVRMICAHPITTAAFYSEMRHLEPAHAQEILEARDRYEDLLEGVILEGQNEGTLTAATPAPLLARATLGTINSVSRWYKPGGAWDADLVSGAFAELVVNGIRSPA